MQQIAVYSAVKEKRFGGMRFYTRSVEISMQNCALEAQ
jgi:hypothetical protein